MRTAGSPACELQVFGCGRADDAALRLRRAVKRTPPYPTPFAEFAQLLVLLKRFDAPGAGRANTRRAVRPRPDEFGAEILHRQPKPFRSAAGCAPDLENNRHRDRWSEPAGYARDMSALAPITGQIFRFIADHGSQGEVE